MGLGEAFALLCAVCWASAVVMFKHAGGTMSANSLNLCKNIFGFLLLLPTAIAVHGVSLPDLTWPQWMVIAVSGYIGIGIADTFYFRALRYIGAGRTAIVTSLYSPIVVILSLAFLGEQLLPWQWVGFAMVLAGIFVVVFRRSYAEVDQKSFYQGIAFAASSIFMTAASVVAMKPVLDSEGFFWIVTLRLLAGIVGMMIYLIGFHKLGEVFKNLTSERHSWHIIFVASFVGTYLAMLFWLGGFKYADASVASVLNETANVMIVIFAWIFLKEPMAKRTFFGVVITFVGVLVFTT